MLAEVTKKGFLLYSLVTSCCYTDDDKDIEEEMKTNKMNEIRPQMMSGNKNLKFSIRVNCVVVSVKWHLLRCSRRIFNETRSTNPDADKQ